MGWFSRSESPDNCKKCKECKEKFEKRKALAQAAREKAAKVGGAKGAEMKAAADRFDNYNKAMIRAKAAEDVYDPQKDPECLRRITDPQELKKMGIDPRALRDDNSGFHAEVYKSEADGSTILAYQGTDPSSLNDWKTNIDNGSGLKTDQYTSAGSIASGMHAAGTKFDIVGHSLGGGLATEGGMAAPGHGVTTFNSAGLSDASLARNGASSFNDIDGRTQAFRTERDFLTHIQEDTNPQHQLANAEQLNREVRGDAGWKNPLTITGNNATKADKKDTAFQGHLKAFHGQMDELIEKARKDVAQGKDPKLFPRSRGARTDVPGLTGLSSGLNQRLSDLNQHTMGSMISRMDSQISADESALQAFTGIK